LKLDLPEPEHEKSVYEPTASSGFGRGNTRLLRGRIDRTSNNENAGTTYVSLEFKSQSESTFNTTSENLFKLKLPSS
jgi:hypothetical protein